MSRIEELYMNDNLSRIGLGFADLPYWLEYQLKQHKKLVLEMDGDQVVIKPFPDVYFYCNEERL
jgi:hypothetical protein